ncbi:MAG: prolipoprotein diacylglyceryl transferase [Chlorobi bacterium]|nr:prolipoprotein diacylglyceryl transferase [Chlorobiota bacterium]
MLEKLKKRWGISGTGQVLVILAVFAVTGFSFIYVNRFIDSLLGMTENTPFWLKALVFIVILLPVYNLLLLAWGTVFGQYRFFSNFIKRFFSRLFFRKKN